ncbi:glycosyl hydrolase family 3 N-terminal domain protein [Lentilactobacillus buchneri ATCC 11577]|nr:glycosyl hydrolase family 3 N-terminal domain protein [Lentilactobacillus buchneri ATCC 11577]MCT3397113.1 glycosyl hydrolase [Lentilactobacillus hilgardii]
MEAYFRYLKRCDGILRSKVITERRHFMKSSEEPLTNRLSKLSSTDLIKLTSGEDFWHSSSLIDDHIPNFRMSDGPNGLRYQADKGDALGINNSVPSTCFPTASAIACTWDPELIRRMGRAIGQEARSLNVDMVLGPGINIKRNPLCGRNFEYFSEDPYLAGTIGAAWIKGLQSQGVGACVKHFAGNNQENDRLRSDSLIDQTALHELYLAAFQIAVTRAQPEGVMCSYNKVNGTYASDNPYLLTTVLRQQWRFKGSVITDWGALNNKIASINAGTDLEMPSSNHLFDKQALAGLKTGQLQNKALYRAAENVIKIAEKKRPVFKGDRSALLKEGGQLAQKIEESAAVLLKNDNQVLPIKSSDEVAVIGEMAAHTRYQGAGSSHINPPESVTILQGLDHMGVHYQYQQGYSLSNQKSDQFITSAVALAKKADKVIFVAGLPGNDESEGFDRKNMQLPVIQNVLIDRIAAINPNVIVLLVAGAPVELPWLKDVKGVLNLYLGGQYVGNAAANLLLGKVNPSGKLAESYPINYMDVPSAAIYDHNPQSVGYAESVYVGYRYYEKSGTPVAFPFGYGLSYTTFKISRIEIDTDMIRESQSIHVKADITNTGNVDGAEVIQVYVGNEEDRPLKPLKELKGFKKVVIRAGQTKSVTVELPAQSFFEWCDASQKWQLPLGHKFIIIGDSSNNVVFSTRIQSKGISFPDKKNLPIWYSKPQGKPTLADFSKMSGLEIKKQVVPKPGQYTKLNTPRELSMHSFIIRKMIKRMKEARLKGISEPNSAAVKFEETIIMDSPLIRLAQQSEGKLSLKTVDKLVEIANRRYIKALL